MKYCTGTYKQVYYQLIAPIFDFTVLLHVSATTRSHLQGATILKVIYIIVVWFVEKSQNNTDMNNIKKTLYVFEYGYK